MSKNRESKQVEAAQVEVVAQVAVDAVVESVAVNSDAASLDFTQDAAIVAASVAVEDTQTDTQDAAMLAYDAVRAALLSRNSVQYSRDNELSLKLLSVAQMQVLVEAKIDAAKFAATCAQHDKSKSDFIAVKALYKVLALLQACATKSLHVADDYTAIILHNARLMQNELTYELASYSLCNQITFDEEKLEKLSSVKLARKRVKASTMSTQRSSSKNALALLQCISFADKKITLNNESVILQKLQALDA